MNTRQPFFTYLLLTTITLFNPAFANPLTSTPTLAPTSSPGPLHIFSQMSDPELVRELEEEETLEDLQNLEFELEALSMGKGVALSFIPSGGLGLMYAGDGIKSLLPIALSLAGYGAAIAMGSGVFDQSAQDVCVFREDQPDEKFVTFETCFKGEATPENPRQHLEQDLRADPTGNLRFFETKNEYSVRTQGRDINRSELALPIAGVTYLVTTVIGITLTAIKISEHNDEIRKKIESTAQAPIKITPTFAVQPDGGLMMGAGLSF